MLRIKKKWLLHLGNLAQTTKWIASSELISVTSRTVSKTLRGTLNEYASNFESLDWDKHHVPEAFFEIISQFYYYIFLKFL